MVRPSDILPNSPVYDIDHHLAYVQELHKTYPMNTQEICDYHAKHLAEGAPTQLLPACTKFFKDLLKMEDIHLPTQPKLKLQNYLTRLQAIFSDIDGIDECFLETTDKFFEHVPLPEATGLATVPLLNYASPNIASIAYSIFGKARYKDFKVFETLSFKLYRNLVEASGFDVHSYDGKKPLTYAHDAKGDPIQIARTYLHGTPLLDLLLTPVPFSIPQQTRFEHTWIVAGSGHGKTTALALMVRSDIDQIIKGEASVVLIDSQNAIIPALSKLAVLAPKETAPELKPGDKIHARHGEFDLTGPFTVKKIGDTGHVYVEEFESGIPGDQVRKIMPEFENRLIIVDPGDLEYPIACNIFDVDLSSKDPRERYANLNNAVEMAEFVLSSLTDQKLTDRQGSLFKYVAEFVITAVEKPTIYDVLELLSADKDLPGKYQAALKKCSPDVADYMQTDFLKGADAKAIKPQVRTRLREVLRNPSLTGMFSAPTTKLDLHHELNQGRLVLVKADKEFFGEHGTKMYGRFWIAQVARAAHRRSTGGTKLPTYFYIDEAQDYLRGGDAKIEGILEQARKQNIGLTILHHFTGQLRSETLLGLLGSNTSTKLVGSLEINDLNRFASIMRCERNFLQDHENQKGTFAAYVRGLTPSALSLTFSYVDLSKEPQMSADQFSVIRDHIRREYCTPSVNIDIQAAAPPPPSKPPEPSGEERW